jgi:Tfp pilus assembly protein PilF
VRYRNFIALLLAAIIILGGCVRETSRNNPAAAHYTLGISYLREPNPTMALKEFLKAVEIAPDNPEYQVALARAYLLKKAHEESERHYLKAIRLNPEQPDYYNDLGALYLEMGRWNDAIINFRKAANNLLFANPALALTGIGYAHHQKGEYLDAVAAYRRALEQDRNFVQAHVHLGKAYDALGKPEFAIREYREALSKSPGYVPANYQLGMAYMKEKEGEKAIAEFETVIELVPNSDYGRQAEEYLDLLH